MIINDEKYIEAISLLPNEVRTALSKVNIQQKVIEISLRRAQPIVISTFASSKYESAQFLCRSGEVNSVPRGELYVLSSSEMDKCIGALTEYSVHSYIDKINMGFITIDGGHRVGIVGTPAVCEGNILNVSDISSLNIRIARQVIGVSEELSKKLFSDGLCSVLIIGPPASGKTTVLRDITRFLAGGGVGGFVKLSVVDERGEIAGMRCGIPQNNIGITADVLNGYPKGIAITTAIRSMSPKGIIIDEIGNEADSASIEHGMNAGVKVIATVHASSFDELRRKEHILRLIKMQAFEKFVLLNGSDNPSKVAKILNADELFNDEHRIIFNGVFSRDKDMVNQEQII